MSCNVFIPYNLNCTTRVYSPLSSVSWKSTILISTIHQSGIWSFLFFSLKDSYRVTWYISYYILLFFPILIHFIDLIVRFLLLETPKQLGILNLNLLKLFFPRGNVKTLWSFISCYKSRTTSSSLTSTAISHYTRYLLQQYAVFSLNLSKSVLQ